MPKMKEIQKVVQKISREQESVASGGGGWAVAAAAAAYEPVQKHKVTTVYQGELMKIKWVDNEVTPL